jgi:hypothetical protein
MTPYGIIEWSKIIQLAPVELDNIILWNNHLYLSGNSPFGTGADSLFGYIVQCDLQGEIVRFNRFHHPAYLKTIFNDAKVVGNELWVGGSVGNGFSPAKTYPFLAALDTAGEWLYGSKWVIDSASSFFSFPNYGIEQIDFTDTDHIYMRLYGGSGYNALLKINPSRNIEWIQKSTTDFSQIVATYDDKLLVSRRNEWKGAFFHVDQNGGLSFKTETTLGGDEQYAEAGVWSRHACGYLVSGKIGWPNDYVAYLNSNAEYCSQDTMAQDFVILRPIENDRFFQLSDTLIRSSISFSINPMTQNLTDTLTAEWSYCKQGSFDCLTSVELAKSSPPLFSLFPNPFNGYLHCIGHCGQVLHVIDVFGVKQSFVAEHGVFNLNALKQGHYFVSFDQANWSSVLKFD